MMKSIILFFAVLPVVFFSDYAGEWAYTVNTPDGQSISASLVLSHADGAYTGVAASSEGELPLKDLKIEEDNFSCHLFYMGYKVNLKGKFDKDVLNITADVDGMQFPIVAKRKVE